LEILADGLLEIEADALKEILLDIEADGLAEIEAEIEAEGLLEIDAERLALGDWLADELAEILALGLWDADGLKDTDGEPCSSQIGSESWSNIVSALSSNTYPEYPGAG